MRARDVVGRVAWSRDRLASGFGYAVFLPVGENTVRVTVPGAATQENTVRLLEGSAGAAEFTIP